MDSIIRAFRRFQPDRKTFEIIAVALIVATAVLFYGFKGESQTILVDGDGSTGEGAAASEESTRAPAKGDIIYVDVDGAVKHPGVYELSPGTRVFEAVDKAGGLKKHADTSNINLAEKVKDGQKISVPSKKAEGDGSTGSGSQAGDGTQVPATGDAGAGTGSSDAEVLSGGDRININSASSEELQQINGIGPATAQKIIDYRNANGPFKNTEELKNVNGIGDKTYEKMKDVVGV